MATMTASQLPTYSGDDLEAIATAARHRVGAVDPDAPPMTGAEIAAARRLHLSIRLAEPDVSALRQEAARLGIPYQTLIGSVLHRFATGELVDARQRVGA
jgi:hypothetical protein